MAVFKSSIRSRVARFTVLILGVVFASSIAAQSRDELIAERLKPVGEVCLAGEPCARAVAATAQASGEFSAEQTYTQTCALCHATGMAGAPKFGDAAEWTARVTAKGMETVVQNAINGINGMPAKGMCMTCSDENIAALVAYISGQNP